MVNWINSNESGGPEKVKNYEDFYVFSMNFAKGNCANGKIDSNGPSLDMDSFGGIYLILCGGVGLALGVALCEFCGKSDDSSHKFS